ncbi:hypothetical protein ACRE_077520 [Hapsidospora chrysogenum ATCC 11550]|uniref:Ecp2 effector protein domain-containing protein n=1 Tax=Hapsidospora chrysogenum (strain ATCC 11550 / CBS 779.69 / DSM 880 / IAM 14645 / JCM 23072 / IMI 49137) TaxID=857340 RepID=A0A086SWN8_HAPC1|nr:hypothetical protein ACRE_077520 [Hapsidospora chrysogenum ATCC 11550]
MHLIGIAALVTGLFAVSVVAQDIGDDMPPGSVESNLAILKDPATMVYAFSEGNWRCDGEILDIRYEVCTEVRENILALGEKHSGWWTPDGKYCQSWMHGRCKATFCPQTTASGELKVYMPDLAMMEFFFVAAMCARENQRGILEPADAGYSIYVSEPEWKRDGEWPV